MAYIFLTSFLTETSDDDPFGDDTGGKGKTAAHGKGKHRKEQRKSSVKKTVKPEPPPSRGGKKLDAFGSDSSMDDDDVLSPESMNTPSPQADNERKDDAAVIASKPEQFERARDRQRLSSDSSSSSSSSGSSHSGGGSGNGSDSDSGGGGGSAHSPATSDSPARDRHRHRSHHNDDDDAKSSAAHPDSDHSGQALTPATAEPPQGKEFNAHEHSSPEEGEVISPVKQAPAAASASLNMATPESALTPQTDDSGDVMTSQGQFKSPNEYYSSPSAQFQSPVRQKQATYRDVYSAIVGEDKQLRDEKPNVDDDERAGMAVLSPETVDIHHDTAPNGEVLAVLLQLQQRLMAVKNKDTLRSIVRIITEAGGGCISKSTFDFDLCRLDANTLRLIQSYVNDANNHVM